MGKNFSDVYRAQGFNCGLCKAEGKAVTNQMRPQFVSPKYNRETKEFMYFKDGDVTVTVPITSRFNLNLHKRREHSEAFKEAEKKARATKIRNRYA